MTKARTKKTIMGQRAFRNQALCLMRNALYERVLPFALAFATVLVCASCLSSCSSSEPERTAARFGDHVITETEVSDYTQAYREKKDLVDNGDWANYLATTSQTAESWRQEAIRTLADRILINDKAAELGITCNLEAVEAKIDQEKDVAGVAKDDDQAWSEYLAERGQTPEQLRSDLEFSDVEQQVFKAELSFDDQMRAEMCDDFISANLADQVVHRYSAIAVPLDDRNLAQRYLQELEGLQGSELLQKFEQLLEEERSKGSELQNGDLGWDFVYNEIAIDPEIELRKAMLQKGELYDGVLEGTDALRIVLCTDWASFARTPTYESLESEDLKDVVESLALVSNWAARCSQYLSDLEEAAQIKITEMPEDAEYAVSDDGL